MSRKGYLPILPLKGGIMFPYVGMPFSVGREGSVAAVKEAITSEEKEIIVAAQRDPEAAPSGRDDLYEHATRGIVRKMQEHGSERLSVIVQGTDRVTLEDVQQEGNLLLASYRIAPVHRDEGPEIEALKQEVMSLVQKALTLMQGNDAADIGPMLSSEGDPLQLMYTIASLLSVETSRAQELLAKDSLLDGMRWLHQYLTHEVRVLEVRQEIAKEAASEMSKEQREYVLRQQMRKIQEELGEEGGEQAEIKELRQRLEQADLPDEVRKVAERELSRLEKLPAAAAEYNVIRTYCEWLLELPWKASSETHVDIPRAREVLDEDHYGLKDVKERILEYLAVIKMNPEAKSPILCFLGPPGVGKTSLGQSIARALGRNFERMSVGGLHDESELRGHRRTYVGAMPGRIIQAMRRAEVNNPLLMLDEVDKLGRDFRGDPAAAMLEILDPAQNHQFRDNYVDVPFDLSDVFFIATVNSLSTIPRPLLDRMEVIRLPGYTHEEKAEIAKRYLLPRQLKEGGMDAEQCNIGDAVIDAIIARYTRESGVRELERTIGRVIRKVALKFAEGRVEPMTVEVEDLPELLGPEPFFAEEARKEVPSGVAAGLAWTETGGEVLYVETAMLPGRKGLTMTGQVGDVMQESAKAAETCMWSRSSALGIDPAELKENGVHVHVPAGAIPKDGPSAGVTIATALTSLYTGLGVRHDTAMTGEVTITGLVLPVGGIKEKLLAARRAGIRRVILPKANEKDLRDIDEAAIKDLSLFFAERIEEAWAIAIPELGERLEVARRPGVEPGEAAEQRPH